MENISSIMTGSRSFSSKNHWSIISLVCLISAMMFSGCLFPAKSPPPQHQYVLAYPSPSFTNNEPFNITIEIGRFGADQEAAEIFMVSSPSPFERSIYNYSLWNVRPGDMLTDCLLRDIRDSGLYRAVFSYRDTAPAQFHLDGSVDQFLEVDGPPYGQKAVVAVTATLFRSGPKDIAKRVVFQKNYLLMEAMKDKTPQALARAMSSAVEKLSRVLQTDVYDAVRNSTIVKGRTRRGH